MALTIVSALIISEKAVAKITLSAIVRSTRVRKLRGNIPSQHVLLSSPSNAGLRDEPREERFQFMLNLELPLDKAPPRDSTHEYESQ
jgi:hypothetical protein